MPEYSVIGQRVPMTDSDERVTGTARYTGDIQLPRMLYAKCLFSPYPHAKIKSIDTSKAEALPGVKAVVTYKDCTGLGVYGFDEPIISDTMRFVGDVVAAVAATDRDIAEEALDLIDVEYEILPFVLDVEEAMEPGAPQVHPEVTDNNVVTIEPLAEEFGDIVKGFAEADHILEDRFETGSHSAAAPEPQTAVASWDGSGKLTVWMCVQGPPEARDVLASIFRLPTTKVRVITEWLGGGFGSDKGTAGPRAALLSRKAGRPVQLAYTEQEQILSGVERPNSVLRIKLGVKNDGTITAVQTQQIINSGAYAAGGIGSASASLSPTVHLRWFRCPNAESKAYMVYTNKPIAGFWRGYGLVFGEFHVEMMLNRAAEKVGMDPLEFRLMNLWTSREEALENGVEDIIENYGLPDCIRQGAEAIGWATKWKGWDTPVAVNGAKRTGIGMANMLCEWATSGYYSISSGFLKMNSGDGTVHVLYGASEVGGGQKTVIAQICAETLGIPYEDVSVTVGDTDTCPYAPGTYADRTTHAVSVMLKVACEEIRAELFELAAPMLEVTPEELDIKDRKIYVKEEPEKSVLLTDVLYTKYPVGDVMGTAVTMSPYSSPVIQGGTAMFAEVEVDTETGKVEVLKLVHATDLGTAVNPAMAENQIQGGILQGGLGHALTEELIIDQASGRMLNPSYLDYRVHTPLDTPEIEPILVQAFGIEAAYGTKGVGNPPIIIPPPAVLSAIRNAIGVDLTEMPATPDRILKALGKV